MRGKCRDRLLDVTTPIPPRRLLHTRAALGRPGDYLGRRRLLYRGLHEHTRFPEPLRLGLTSVADVRPLMMPPGRCVRGSTPWGAAEQRPSRPRWPGS